MELVARHADQWNAAWYGDPDKADELRERLANLRVALEAAGRDPSTLVLTAGIFVAAEDDPDAPESAIRGSVAQIANALAGYEALGISHLIAHVWPRTPKAVSTLAEAAGVARDRVLVSR